MKDVLDFRNMETIKEWADRMMPCDGADIPAQYNYMKDRHPVEWHGNVEMETNRYTKARK